MGEVRRAKHDNRGQDCHYDREYEQAMLHGMGRRAWDQRWLERISGDKKDEDDDDNSFLGSIFGGIFG